MIKRRYTTKPKEQQDNYPCRYHEIMATPMKCLRHWENLRWEITSCIIQGDSVARGPRLLSIKNYVIEIMT